MGSMEYCKDDFTKPEIEDGDVDQAVASFTGSGN